MIHTLTANPSLDLFLEVTRLLGDDISRVTGTRLDAGGKGVNVVRAAGLMGGRGLALGWCGGETGRRLKHLLKKEEIPFLFLEIAGETRTIYNIRERATGRIYRVNEPGPRVGRADIGRLFETIASLPEKAPGIFAICGSAPPGTPPGFYARLIRVLAKQGIRTVLDSDNELFSRGAAARPDIIKPNLHELGRLAGRPVATRRETLRAARALLETGIGTVIVSMGSRGAMAVERRGAYLARAPRVRVKSTIGAGDALLAGFLVELDRGGGTAAALKTGVAAGSASVTRPGTAPADARSVLALREHVSVIPI